MGFIKMSGGEGDPVPRFSHRQERHCIYSTRQTTDRELLGMQNEKCLRVDMLREVIAHPSSVMTRLISHSILAQSPQDKPESNSPESAHRSYPMRTANTASCGTAGNFSSSSADDSHTGSDNTTPSSQHPQNTSQRPGCRPYIHCCKHRKSNSPAGNSS
jgi:hypothetical protein